MSYRRVPVPVGDHSYDVLVGKRLLSGVGGHCRALGFCGRCAIVTDSNVGPLYAEVVRASLSAEGFEPSLFVSPAGEGSKSMEEASRLLEMVACAGLDRSSLIIALGGGVVGDLAAFVAGVYMRGVGCIQIPTTIVSQVDSAVGGKTGVNLAAGKNLAGVFHHPRLVLADTETLESLPAREFFEGFAEVIKHGAIRDVDLLTRLELFERGEDIDEIIARNVAIKAEIVAGDEKEQNGLRALLNFGHTIGHGIEQAAGYGRYFHGEAVGLGMIAAGRLSRKLAGLSNTETERLEALIRRFHLPCRLDVDVSAEKIELALTRDKKFSGGSVRFVLLNRLGEAHLSDQVTYEDIRNAIQDLQG